MGNNFLNCASCLIRRLAFGLRYKKPDCKMDRPAKNMPTEMHFDTWFPISGGVWDAPSGNCDRRNTGVSLIYKYINNRREISQILFIQKCISSHATPELLHSTHCYCCFRSMIGIRCSQQRNDSVCLLHILRIHHPRHRCQTGFCVRPFVNRVLNEGLIVSA